MASKLLVLGCLIAMIIFHAFYWPEFTTLIKYDHLFQAIWGVLLIGWVICSYIVIRDSDDPDNKWRIICTVLFAALTIWQAAWCSDRRAKVSDHIEYHYPGEAK